MEHIECFVYSLADGQTAENLRQAVEETQNQLVKNQDGFLDRRLVQLEDRRFLEMIRWQSREHMEKAFEVIMNSPVAGQLMQAIEESSMMPLHGELVASYAGRS